jgi:aspartate kinase
MKYTMVMKFGGGVLRNPDDFRRAAKIITDHRAEDPIAVVSAVGASGEYTVKTTDLLLRAADRSLPTKQRKQALNKVVDWHEALASSLGCEEDLLGHDFTQLGAEFKNPAKPMGEREYKDLIASHGEPMAAKLLADVLTKSGYPSIPVNAPDIGFVTTSNFGDADLLDSSYPIIVVELQKKATSASGDRCLVVTGFTGVDNKKRATTMGRGSSDYTTVAIGAAINAEVYIFKDVPGFLTAPPDIIPDANVIPELSYAEAQALGLYGVDVVCHKAIGAARKRSGLKIHVRNIGNPTSGGTLITSGKKKTGIVKGIATCSIDVIKIYPGRYGAEGADNPECGEKHARRVFRRRFDSDTATTLNVFSAMDHVVVLSYSCTVPGHATFLVRDPTHSSSEFVHDNYGFNIGGESDKCLVTLVGDGIGDNMEVRHRFYRVLDGVRKQFPEPVFYRDAVVTETSIGVALKKRAKDATVKTLYKEFFP